MIKFKTFRVIHSWTLSKLKIKFSTEAKTFELDTPHFKSYIIRACSTCTVDVRYFPKWQLPKSVLAAVLSLKHVLATALGPPSPSYPQPTALIEHLGSCHLGKYTHTLYFNVYAFWLARSQWIALSHIDIRSVNFQIERGKSSCKFL